MAQTIGTTWATSENVAVVKGLYDGWWSTDEWRERVAVDVIWDASAVRFAGASGIYRGHAGVEKFFRKWLGPWENATAELLEIAEAGDSVYAAFRWHGRARGSGVQVEREFFGVYDFRDGVVVRFRQKATKAEALEVAGLSDQATIPAPPASAKPASRVSSGAGRGGAASGVGGLDALKRELAELAELTREWRDQ